MWIKKKEVEQLSEFVKGYISGEEPDIRDNREGVFNILKNDIYSLVNKKNEQIKEEMNLPEYASDVQKLMELSTRFEENENQLLELYEKWEELSE